MDVFRIEVIVTRACFSAVNLGYERFLCAYQRLTGRDTPGISNDRSG